MFKGRRRSKKKRQVKVRREVWGVWLQGRKKDRERSPFLARPLRFPAGKKIRKTIAF